MHQDVLVPAMINVLEIVAALRAKLALDINPIVPLDLGPELGRDQVQGLFVHRAVFYGIDSPI